MNDQNYQAVLDFYRSSIRDERLLDVASPLPPLISLELKMAAELIDQQPPPGDAGRGEALRQAVTQFAEKILFSDQGNYYRILGLNRDADTAQLKDHYKWLTRLLFPVEDMAHWNEADGELLNHAYGVLRDPKYRKAYDEELLNRGGVDRTLDVKRDEAVAQAGSGRGGAAKAVASVLEREQYPEEENITPEQAPAQAGGETQEASVGEANIHQVSPRPSTKTGTSRFPEDLMTAAGSAGPAPTAIPEIDSGEFPSPELTDHEIRRSWGSLAMMIGFPIVVGLAVLVYLGYIPLSFMDDQVKSPPLSVSINPPETAETGQFIVRSEQPLQDSAAGDGGGQDTVVEPSHDGVSDLRADTREPLTSTAGGAIPGLADVPDKQAAAPSPDTLPKRDVVATATPAPAREIKPVPSAVAPLSSGAAKRESVATSPKDTAKTVRTEPQPKPAAPPPPVKSKSKEPPSPATGSPGHPKTASVASAPAPAREIKPAPPPAASLSSAVAKREAVVTPSEDTVKTTHAEQGPKPAAPPPSPVKSTSEQPSAPSADLSVKPPPGDDKLATAA